ncbi:hypothetical protein C5167_042685 [Papaver somniferum]|uniref:Uncharacterized protein n=1 Tax=Papaver somniferum TaxID=3469 RepID=A0A4Y7L6P2_PAPSO|nr:hypothetical protein C5167_042685 [Papaver somniferum]
MGLKSWRVRLGEWARGTCYWDGECACQAYAGAGECTKKARGGVREYAWFGADKCVWEVVSAPNLGGASMGLNDVSVDSKGRAKTFKEKADFCSNVFGLD